MSHKRSATSVFFIERHGGTGRAYSVPLPNLVSRLILPEINPRRCFKGKICTFQIKQQKSYYLQRSSEIMTISILKKLYQAQKFHLGIQTMGYLQTLLHSTNELQPAPQVMLIHMAILHIHNFFLLLLCHKYTTKFFHKRPFNSILSTQFYKTIISLCKNPHY